MTPIILIKEKNGNGKIEITEEELKQIISDAYEQGYEDSKKQNQVPMYISPIPSNPSDNWWDRQIYCGPTTTATGQMPSSLTDSHPIPNQNVTLRG